MKAHRKVFWWSLIGSILTTSVLIMLYIFESKLNSTLILEVLKVCVSGVATGLIVSAFMAYANHNNEKNKYMEKLFQTANLFYYSITRARLETTSAMFVYEVQPDKLMNAAKTLVSIFSVASEDLNKADLFSDGGYFPLLGGDHLRFKKEQLIFETGRYLCSTREFLQSVYTLASNCKSQNSPETVDTLFISFYNYRTHFNNALQQIDNYMYRLERKYRFNVLWDKAKNISNNSILQEHDTKQEQECQRILDKISGTRNMSNVMKQIQMLLQGNSDVIANMNVFGNLMTMQNQITKDPVDAKEVPPCHSPN